MQQPGKIDYLSGSEAAALYKKWLQEKRTNHIFRDQFDPILGFGKGTDAYLKDLKPIFSEYVVTYNEDGEPISIAPSLNAVRL